MPVLRDSKGKFIKGSVNEDRLYPKWAEERKIKHKEWMLANNPFKGKTHSKETKEKMRLAKLGKIGSNLGKTWKVDKSKLVNFGKQKGEIHWNWKGGITPLKKSIRMSKKWSDWRKEVFERDNYTCQNIKCKFCNNKKGTELHPHHIIPFTECMELNFLEMAFNIDNGISYCKDYHLKSGLHRGVQNSV